MKEIISKIIEDSVTAPSPDNFQPWRFEVRNQIISVYKVPAKMNHLLDCREHVLILTIGMLIENIVISSSDQGCRCDVNLFPANADDNLVARLGIHRDPAVKKDSLYDFLKVRCTTRKMYGKQKISQEVLNDLSGTLKNFPGIELQLITEQSDIKKIGKAVSAIDQIMCQNKQLHRELFRHITWSKKEEQETHQGLSLDSLELNSGEKMLFKAIKNWRVINTLNKIGFSNVIRSQNASQYSSAPSSVVVSIKEDSRSDYLNAGRFVQRFWLKATSFKLSLHPIVGVIYCTQKLNQEDTGSLFTDQQALLLKESYSIMEGIATAHGKTSRHIVFYFRMGYSKPTGYQSSRKKADISFTGD